MFEIQLNFNVKLNTESYILFDKIIKNIQNPAERINCTLTSRLYKSFGFSAHVFKSFDLVAKLLIFNILNKNILIRFLFNKRYLKFKIFEVKASKFTS